MRNRSLALLTLIICAASALSAAEPKVYKWTDETGTVHFSTTQPDQNAEEVRLQKAPKFTPVDTPAASAATAEDDAARCAQHSANLKLLEAQGQALSIQDKGVLRALTAEEREQQLSAARAALERCAKTPPTQ